MAYVRVKMWIRNEQRARLNIDIHYIFDYRPSIQSALAWYYKYFPATISHPATDQWTQIQRVSHLHQADAGKWQFHMIGWNNPKSPAKSTQKGNKTTLSEMTVAKIYITRKWICYGKCFFIIWMRMFWQTTVHSKIGWVGTKNWQKITRYLTYCGLVTPYLILGVHEVYRNTAHSLLLLPCVFLIGNVYHKQRFFFISTEIFFLQARSLRYYPNKDLRSWRDVTTSLTPVMLGLS